MGRQNLYVVFDVAAGGIELFPARIPERQYASDVTRMGTSRRTARFRRKSEGIDRAMIQDVLCVAGVDIRQ